MLLRLPSALGVLLFLACSDAPPADDAVSVVVTRELDTLGCRHGVRFAFELESPRRTTVDLAYRVSEASDGALGTMYTASLGGIALEASAPRRLEDVVVSPVPSPGSYAVSVTVTREGATIVPWRLAATFELPAFAAGMVPSDGVPPLEANCAVIDGRLHFIDGFNRARDLNQLILYVRNKDWTSTGTNEWGAEAQIVGGRIVQVKKPGGDSGIPQDGYVLSAHGDADLWWLRPRANLDAGVILLK